MCDKHLCTKWWHAKKAFVNMHDLYKQHCQEFHNIHDQFKNSRHQWDTQHKKLYQQFRNTQNNILKTYRQQKHKVALQASTLTPREFTQKLLSVDKHTQKQLEEQQKLYFTNVSECQRTLRTQRKELKCTLKKLKLQLTDEFLVLTKCHQKVCRLAHQLLEQITSYERSLKYAPSKSGSKMSKELTIPKVEIEPMNHKEAKT